MFKNWFFFFDKNNTFINLAGAFGVVVGLKNGWKAHIKYLWQLLLVCKAVFKILLLQVFFSWYASI